MTTKEWMENFLVKEPPYKEIDLTPKSLYHIGLINTLVLTHYCEKCQQLRTFKSNLRPFEDINNCHIVRFHNLIPGYSDEQWEKEYNNVFLIEFTCQHDCGEAHYITLQIANSRIQKIGEFPTFAKEEVNTKLFRYKSLISEFYPELTKAVSAYSQNMGVASFVYLRRILEHLIEGKYKQYGGTAEESKFIDKLHVVEKYEKVIPDDFNEIKNQIYSVLSKGVHEYEESECLTLFPAVKYIIESILDEELLKREKAKKTQEAKKIIQEKLHARDKKHD